MNHFKNFKVSVYFMAQGFDETDDLKLQKEYDFIEKYAGIDKIYLENFRGEDVVSKDKIKKAADFFRSKGVEVAGGMTATYKPRSESDREKNRLFDTLCYCDETMRAKLTESAEQNAALFDEFILDDFFFTNCTCDECRRRKGNRSWSEFREELMNEVSENVIIAPAKKVNPNVKITIKFPNWRESYHGCGYDPDRERNLFDNIHTGTETRCTPHQDQHLPRYAGYSIMRFLENAAPGRNNGGWIDNFQCWSLDTYLEQAYFNIFARPKELTLFCWQSLAGAKWLTGMGYQLERLDKVLDECGAPEGIPVYIPFHSNGENHIEDFLGMQGFAFEPVPDFPEKDDQVFLTEAALFDGSIFEKLSAFLEKGGSAYVTPGFVKGMDQEKWSSLSSVRFTGRKITADRYFITDDPAGYYDDNKKAVFEDIQHINNASWSLVNCGSNDYHTPMFIRDAYGKGMLYILNTPENPAEIEYIAPSALDAVKRAINRKGIYISGRNVSMFMYDNDTFVLYGNMKAPVHPVHVTVHMDAGKYKAELTDVTDDRKVEVYKKSLSYDFKWISEYTADVIIEPGEWKVFKVSGADN